MPPNKRLQLPAAVGSMLSGGRSGADRAAALRSMLGWFARGRS
jgi:hypothetical protein